MEASTAAADPAPDAAPDSLAAGTAEPLRGELEGLLGADRVLSRPSDIVHYASDASPYRLLLRAVVMAHDARDVAAVMAYGREHGIPVVFRGSGTSLSGQAQTDGIPDFTKPEDLGLERATGQPYESVVQLLERLTRS